MDANTKLPVVYIVDDDESVLRALARLVRAGGFLPKPYTSPESFLREFAAESPACILLDILMPGNGVSAAGRTQGAQDQNPRHHAFSPRRCADPPNGRRVGCALLSPQTGRRSSSAADDRLSHRVAIGDLPGLQTAITACYRPSALLGAAAAALSSHTMASASVSQM